VQTCALPICRGSAIRVLGFEGMTRCYRSATDVQGPAVPVFGAAVFGAAFVSIVGAAALIAALSGVLTASIVAAIAVIVFGPVIAVAGILVVAGAVVVLAARAAVVLPAVGLGLAAPIAALSGVLPASIVAAVAVIVFGPVIAVAGILVVAGPVVVIVARGAVVLTAFVLGIGVLVLVLLVVVIRLLGRLLVRGLVLGVVAVAAVAARTAVAAARGAGLGCGRLGRVLRLGLVGQFTASGELLDLLALERLLHVVGPDLHRERSAGDLSASAVGADRHFLAVDLAVEDDGGREIR